MMRFLETVAFDKRPRRLGHKIAHTPQPNCVSANRELLGKDPLY